MASVRIAAAVSMLVSSLAVEGKTQLSSEMESGPQEEKYQMDEYDTE